MTIEIPTYEPATLYAGTTVAWTKSLPDYPATTYTLTYYLVGPVERYVITASASGSDYSIAVTAATSATWVAGKYRWASYAVNGATKYPVESGVVEIKLNMQTAVAGDLRTHARKVLDAIEAVIENRASKDQEAMSIAGRSLQRTPIADLMTLRSRYAIEVAREEAAAKGNREGMRRAYVRFARV